MAWRLKASVALPLEDPGSIPSPYLHGISQPSAISVLGDLTPSSGFLEHYAYKLPLHTRRQILIYITSKSFKLEVSEDRAEGSISGAGGKLQELLQRASPKHCSCWQGQLPLSPLPHETWIWELHFSTQCSCPSNPVHKLILPSALAGDSSLLGQQLMLRLISGRSAENKCLLSVKP